MSPDELLPEDHVRRLCARHGVDPLQHAYLVPLVKKALDAPTSARERILALIDAHLAERAAGRASAESLWVDLDREVLLAVARVLHTWTPSDGILNLGGGFLRSDEAA